MVADRTPKLIAFYLPQFHPIPENDLWWGKGFTEWRNVAKAKPLYRGHYQPHLPADLGFYDLRVSEVREQQADLARQYGIYAFCYYYYWFNGRRLLERPLEDMLEQQTPDFPFCICWANENWSRRWDGSEDEILIAQEHSAQSDERFILDVLPILKDRRYVRVDGKPMLLVYRVDILPDAAATAANWRRVAAAHGIPDLHLCAVQSFGISDPRPYGFDAAVEFPPHGLTRGDAEDDVSGLALHFTGRIFDYREATRLALSRPEPDYTLHRGLMNAWDNTPRRGARGFVYEHATPTNYSRWLSVLVEQSRTNGRASEFIFINAWNEWAEGAHLEPDLERGHGYLQATSRALQVGRSIALTSSDAPRERTEPLVSVVLVSSNSDHCVVDAIASVERQTYDNIELIVVDDGSTDESVGRIEDALSASRFRSAQLYTHPSLGIPTTINRGVMLARGRYVAVVKAEDVFNPGRVRTLVERAADADEVFLFSSVAFEESEDETTRARAYRAAIRRALVCPTAGYGLLSGWLTASVSNHFFSRELFEKLRGFDAALSLLYDWDFALRATARLEPAFVPEELVTLNRRTFSRAPGEEHEHGEAQAVLKRYLQIVDTGADNRLAPSRKNWPLFFDVFCSEMGLPVQSNVGLEEASFVDAAQPTSLDRDRDAAAATVLRQGLRDGRMQTEPLAVVQGRLSQAWSRRPRSETLN